MSVYLWRVLVEMRSPDSPGMHTLACVSPTARVAMEQVKGGIALGADPPVVRCSVKAVYAAASYSRPLVRTLEVSGSDNRGAEQATHAIQAMGWWLQRQGSALPIHLEAWTGGAACLQERTLWTHLTSVQVDGDWVTPLSWLPRSDLSQLQALSLSTHFSRSEATLPPLSHLSNLRHLLLEDNVMSFAFPRLPLAVILTSCPLLVSVHIERYRVSTGQRGVTADVWMARELRTLELSACVMLGTPGEWRAALAGGRRVERLSMKPLGGGVLLARENTEAVLTSAEVAQILLEHAERTRGPPPLLGVNLPSSL